ncbi:class I SAM-dependent methyltransferase [Nonomuraea africana]|uniref:Ubiquinone/menaquinone biosynthesis C-methylase UbiE n=1 Tax=Nonomuraea africana TaxID=46171 RepID=A0ABR9KM58_9ACTN|nr:class I SAM-dependent methyltransferase [Nonomuraea africana]MBE1563104.1 ubiquinone/menaquinone biosynthesis C-methylase UbiE [Nonomuraea africana]
MLTVDFARLPVGPGMRVLDLGCGGGRHAFEVLRRGADVVAFDMDQSELDGVKSMFAAMEETGEAVGTGETVQGTALDMPFEDGTFDRVIAAEVLEHIHEDTTAMREILRVLKPGGLAAVTVPAFLPERISWALSEEYHTAPGGHIRIYTLAELRAKLKATGFKVGPHHFAHGLHAPYWWIKCAVGVDNDEHPLVKAYHQLLVWDIMKRPRTTRIAEAVLNQLIGKSVVLYLRKPA